MTETDKPKEGVVEETLPTNIAKQGEAADAAQQAIIDAGKEGDEKTGDLIDPAQALDTKDEKKPEDTPQPVEPVKDEPKEGTLAWYKQRYTVLQGKYDSEIPSLHATIRQQTDTIELLNTAYDDMKAQFDELKAGGAQEDTTGTDTVPGQVDAEKFEGYGQEMIELVDTMNKLVAENARLKAGFTDTAKLKDDLTNVAERVEASTWNEFTSALTGAVNDWQAINASQDWLVWLGQPDPMSGVKRDDLLRNATASYDVQRTANIINAFKQEKGLSINSSAPAPAKENLLEGQILPSNASGEVVPDDSLPAGFKRDELVTTAELTAALKQTQTGRITETEYNKISNQYQKQVNAGIRI